MWPIISKKAFDRLGGCSLEELFGLRIKNNNTVMLSQHYLLFFYFIVVTVTVETFFLETLQTFRSAFKS